MTKRTPLRHIFSLESEKFEDHCAQLATTAGRCQRNPEGSGNPTLLPESRPERAPRTSRRGSAPCGEAQRS